MLERSYRIPVHIIAHHLAKVVSDVEQSIVVRPVLEVDEANRVVFFVVDDVAAKQVVVTKDDVWAVLHDLPLESGQLVTTPLHRKLPMESVVHHRILVVFRNLPQPIVDGLKQQLALSSSCLKRSHKHEDELILKQTTIGDGWCFLRMKKHTYLG